MSPVVFGLIVALLVCLINFIWLFFLTRLVVVNDKLLVRLTNIVGRDLVNRVQAFKNFREKIAGAKEQVDDQL